MSSPYDDTMEGEPASWSTPKPRAHDPRGSAAYRQLRQQFIDYCRLHRNPDGTVGLPCAVPGCGRPINYRLRYPHPQAPQLDHIQSVRDHPELVLSWANFQIAHAVCNQRRHGELTDDLDLDLGEPSEVW